MLSFIVPLSTQDLGFASLVGGILFALVLALRLLAASSQRRPAVKAKVRPARVSERVP